MTTRPNHPTERAVVVTTAHRSQVIRDSEHRKIPSTIPGLSYTKIKISSYKYFTLDHDASDKHIATFTGGPVGERDKDFMNHIDSVIRPIGVDWTKNEIELSHALSPEKAMQLHNAISTATIKGDDQRIRIRK